MADSTDKWLVTLAKRMDARASEIERLRNYATGKAPLPEMGENLRASWIKFQKKSRTDYGGLAVGSLADRITVQGVQIGDTNDNDAVIAARRIWRDNRLDVQFASAILDYLQTGWGYIAVGLDGGSAMVTRERPEQFIAAADPLRPWRARAALKVWRDADAGMDFARVWADGIAQTYARQTRNDLGMLQLAAHVGWMTSGDPDQYDGMPPVAILDRGSAFLAPHTDVIDRINLGKLQRLVTTAMQAFIQRAVKGNLPEKDSDGNEIDWAKAFEPAPGALWDLPEGIDIWESRFTDIRPMLEGEKTDARDFAAVTRTPISVLLPDGANQSAEGAAAATKAQVMQARSEIKQLKPAIAVAIVYALRAEGFDLGADTVEILWDDAEHVSQSEKYAAASQAKAAGLPLRHIFRDILGMSQQQIAQAEQDIAAEQLSLALLTAPSGAGNG